VVIVAAGALSSLFHISLFAPPAPTATVSTPFARPPLVSKIIIKLALLACLCINKIAIAKYNLI
jgi:hypothetical protein